MLLRINDEITVATVNLWDDKGQWRSGIALADAIALAHAAHRDLIEFAPKTAPPPTCRIGDAGEYRATGLARDLAEARGVTNPKILDLITRFEEKGIRSGKYLLLLAPADALQFAEEAAASGIGISGLNYWYGPGWEWAQAPDYSSLEREPDFVQRSLELARKDVEQHLPEGVAFVEPVLVDPMRQVGPIMIMKKP